MTLKTGDFSVLSRLLDEALELPEPAREAWLGALPPGDRAFEPLLRDMLAAQSARTQDRLLSTLPRLSGGEAGPAAQPGDRVGPYVLQRGLGHGGMGTVWLAQRVDGTLKRQVALKLPRLAWDDGLAQRVARERDIAVRLEHPHIARLYDAGVDEHGRPYLAFEYIDGRPIDVWCSSRRLAPDACLALFVQVVRAVAYAHGRLVVHRDIKPSNVLVSDDGQAHLLDFGIGKLLHEAAEEGAAGAGTALTREHGRALTPRYASPEQLRNEPVTVATDVYSLGVLLFELLSGQPRHPASLRGLAALERAVLDQDAPLMSQRAAEPALARALRGELDAIVAKALKRDPAERYATADAMADDLQRRLRGARVLARPDSLAYRLATTVRQHRVGVLASSAVLLAVLGGAAAAVVQAQRAGAAAERANAVKAFVVDIFQVNSSGGAELRALPAELLLERGASLIDGKFPGQPALQAELYGVVGGIFAETAAHEQAVTYATRQLAALAAADAPAEQRARATLLLGRGLHGQRRFDDARVRLQQALELAAGHRGLQGSVWLALAQVEDDAGSAQEADRLLERAEALLAAGDAVPLERAQALVLRANLLSHANHFDRAQPYYRQAMDIARQAQGPLSPMAADILQNLQRKMLQAWRYDDARALGAEAQAVLQASGTAGRIQAAIGDSRALAMAFWPLTTPYDEARRALERHRAFLAAQPGVPEGVMEDMDARLMALAVFYGDIEAAERRGATAVPTQLARRSTPALIRIEILNHHGQLRAGQGRHDEAAASFRQIIALQRQLGLVHHPYVNLMYGFVARNLIDAGRLDEAQQALDEAPEPEPLIRGGAPGTASLSLNVARMRAVLALRRNEPQQALALMEAAGSWQGFMQTWMQAEILCANGRAAQGLAQLEQGLEAAAPHMHPHAPGVAMYRAQAGHCALALGQRAKAAAHAAQAARSAQVHAPLTPAYVPVLKALQQQLRAGG